MCKNIIRSEKDLATLATLITQSFSFDHKTMEDASLIVKAGIYTYKFDATTLLPYDCNLNSIEARKLDDLLRPFYLEMKANNREAYKELCERRTLLFCMRCAPEPYRVLAIEKSIRPDFVLTGEKRIGIEITELTVEFDKKVSVLSDYIEKRGLDTAEEIRGYIQKYHKGIADRIEVISSMEKPIMSSGMYCLSSNRKHFAEEIKKKYDMYIEQLPEFDEFIILGNAASGTGLEISCKEEVQEVIDYLLTICPDIINVTTIIAWRESGNHQKINHTWYKVV